MYLRSIPEEAADGSVAELYEADRDRLGYVADYTRAFALRPEAYGGWQALNGAIKASMDLRRYELATLAAARALRSDYCTLAHAAVLRTRFLSDPELERLVAEDAAEAVLPPEEAAIVRFAEKLTREPHRVGREDVDALRAHGLSDEDVLDVALAAAARSFFSRVLHAVGAVPDAPLVASFPPGLRASLAGEPQAAEARSAGA